MDLRHRLAEARASLEPVIFDFFNSRRAPHSSLDRQTLDIRHYFTLPSSLAAASGISPPHWTCRW